MRWHIDRKERTKTLTYQVAQVAVLLESVAVARYSAGSIPSIEQRAVAIHNGDQAALASLNPSGLAGTFHPNCRRNDSAPSGLEKIAQLCWGALKLSMI
jgi:hypothetical protein